MTDTFLIVIIFSAVVLLTTVVVGLLRKKRTGHEDAVVEDLKQQFHQEFQAHVAPTEHRKTANPISNEPPSTEEFAIAPFKPILAQQNGNGNGKPSVPLPSFLSTQTSFKTTMSSTELSFKTADKALALNPKGNLSQIDKMNFPEIYNSFDIEVLPFTVEKGLELMNTLPTNADMQLKSQIVLQAMKAFGHRVEDIQDDANNKKRILSYIVEKSNKECQDLIETSEMEIERLKAQIANLESKIKARNLQQERTIQMCEKEKEKIETVIAFYQGGQRPD